MSAASEASANVNAPLVASVDRLRRVREHLERADAELTRLIGNFAGQKEQRLLELARRRLRDARAHLDLPIRRDTET